MIIPGFIVVVVDDGNRGREQVQSNVRADSGCHRLGAGEKRADVGPGGSNLKMLAGTPPKLAD